MQPGDLVRLQSIGGLPPNLIGLIINCTTGKHDEYLLVLCNSRLVWVRKIQAEKLSNVISRVG